jgi:sugar phosphate isomerase/epimerase
MFWQQMDPPAVVRYLREAVYHVHLKDSQVVPHEVALAGVLDNRPFGSGHQRAWVFRTIGRSHGAEFWADLVDALQEVGYDDVLSIENEDVSEPPVESVQEAAALMRTVLDRSNRTLGAKGKPES